MDWSQVTSQIKGIIHIQQCLNTEIMFMCSLLVCKTEIYYFLIKCFFISVKVSSPLCCLGNIPPWMIWRVIHSTFPQRAIRSATQGLWVLQPDTWWEAWNGKQRDVANTVNYLHYDRIPIYGWAPAKVVSRVEDLPLWKHSSISNGIDLIFPLCVFNVL